MGTRLTRNPSPLESASGDFPSPQPREENTMSNPKYPDVEVQLVGEDGNAFSIMGRVTKALRKAGVAQNEIDAYREEATSGDYDNLLQTTMRWVECS